MSDYCFTVPILPGGEQKIRQWINDGIKNNPDHDRFFHEAGITCEQVWIQRTPMGDFAVVHFEVKDAEKTFKTLSTSQDPWAIRFRDFLRQAHGADFSKTMPLNEQVVDWGVMEKMRT